jgi:hypothetical protein
LLQIMVIIKSIKFEVVAIKFIKEDRFIHCVF